jgi:TPR repeat protein
MFYMTNKDRLNYNEASKWFQMAGSKQNTNTIYQLGCLYENGQGTIQNYSMAYRLYSRAKEKGHQEFIYRLGIAYQYGLGRQMPIIKYIYKGKMMLEKKRKKVQK